MNRHAQNGSALLMVIWTILVLSVLVVSFAFEAKLQSSANVYMRERVHMDHLITAGKTLGEMIIATHQSVVDAPAQTAGSAAEASALEEDLEKDRWVCEKRQLKKTGSSVTIGPIQIDEGDPEDATAEVQGGTVTIQIESVGGGEGGGPKFNINNLYPEGNPHFAEIWKGILTWAGVPEDDQEYFVNAWIDWRDSDDVMTGPYGEDHRDGGEKEFYEDFCKNARDKSNEDVDEEVYKPRNGPIPELKELAKLAPFREHPGLLTGGVYNPDDKEEDQIPVQDITQVLTVFGGNKINVNTASKEVLLCIPGIRDIESKYADDDAELIAQVILDWREGFQENGNEVNLEDEEDGTLIKDWSKLLEITSGEIGKEAQEYLGFTGGQGDGALYLITITAESVGMKHVVRAKMTIRESKPVYLEWQEDP